MTRTGVARWTCRACCGAGDRALDVQGVLWRRGRVRVAGFPDLLIAAVAEREHVTLLHYDSDYDFIAEVTGQQMLWVVPRGTAL